MPPQISPSRTPLRVAVVRGHRINVNDIPSLFSEGPEPEPDWIERQPWLNFETIGRGLKRLALSTVQTRPAAAPIKI
jgi:hypothetical protein